MRRKTAVILAGLLIGGVVGLEVLEAVMRTAAYHWAEQGTMVPLSGRMLLGIAVFWGHIKWLAALPAILALVFLIVTVLIGQRSK